MRTAIGSDERSELTDALVAELQERGHEIVAFGPVANEEESDWPLVCGQVAETVAAGEADEGIVCCWTGTGASIAANKVLGVIRKSNKEYMLEVAARCKPLRPVFELRNASWFDGANQNETLDFLRCPRCERPIRSYENIPIVSWLGAKRGRASAAARS